MSDFIEILIILGYVSYCAVASIAFWLSNRGCNFITRLSTSAHGISILFAFGLAILINELSLSSFSYMQEYTALCLAPLASMLFSLFKHRGSKWFHLFHIGLLPALLWAWFIGGMYITGDSL